MRTIWWRRSIGNVRIFLRNIVADFDNKMILDIKVYAIS